jgi:hypothetical protein
LLFAPPAAFFTPAATDFAAAAVRFAAAAVVAAALAVAALAVAALAVAALAVADDLAVVDRAVVDFVPGARLAVVLLAGAVPARVDLPAPAAEAEVREADGVEEAAAVRFAGAAALVVGLTADRAVTG